MMDRFEKIEEEFTVRLVSLSEDVESNSKSLETIHKNINQLKTDIQEIKIMINQLLYAPPGGGPLYEAAPVGFEDIKKNV